MKKIIAILLILVLCFSLFSCKKEVDNDEPYIESVDRTESGDDAAQNQEQTTPDEENNGDTTEDLKQDEGTPDEDNNTEFNINVSKNETDEQIDPLRKDEVCENNTQSSEIEGTKDSNYKPFYSVENTQPKTSDDVDAIEMFSNIKTPEYKEFGVLVEYGKESKIEDEGIQLFDHIIKLQKAPENITVSEDEVFVYIGVRYNDKTGNMFYYYPDVHLLQCSSNEKDVAGEFYVTTDEFEEFFRSLFIPPDYTIEYVNWTDFMIAIEKANAWR